MNFQLSSRTFIFAVLPVVLLCSSAALAQTDAELLVKPWEKGQLVEARADGVWLNDGHLKDGSDFQLSMYESRGRARLLPDQKADPRFGYDVMYMDVDNESGVLPNNLVDTSVAFGMGVADMDGWLAGITVGVGYAAAGAYNDGNAYYGKADFVIGKELDENTSLGFVLDYDGNRTIMPDVPLPGFAYTKRIDETIRYAVGFPFNSVTWTPDPSTTGGRQLTVEARFAVPDSFDARVDYALIKQLSVYASASSRQEAFHWNELPNPIDRILFQQRRVEGGVLVTPVEQLNLILAAGYAFDQEFNVGFDTRDQDRIAKPSDEAYLRVGLEFKF